MNIYGHPAIDPDRPLGAKVARAGLPALRTDAYRIAAGLDAISTSLRHYQTKIEAAILAIEPDLPPMDGLENRKTPIDLQLDPALFDRAEKVVRDMLLADRHLTIDDALARIFAAGLDVITHPENA